MFTPKFRQTLRQGRQQALIAITCIWLPLGLFVFFSGLGGSFSNLEQDTAVDQMLGSYTVLWPGLFLSSRFLVLWHAQYSINDNLSEFIRLAFTGFFLVAVGLHFTAIQLDIEHSTKFYAAVYVSLIALTYLDDTAVPVPVLAMSLLCGYVVGTSLDGGRDMGGTIGFVFLGPAYFLPFHLLVLRATHMGPIERALLLTMDRGKS